MHQELLAEIYFALFVGWLKVSTKNLCNYNTDWYCGLHSFVAKKYKQIH